MRLFLKIFLFIFTMIITVEEAQSSAVINLSQEITACLFQQTESNIVFFICENHYDNSCLKEKKTAIYSEQGRVTERVAAKGGQTIVGEGMKRVSMEAAKRPGSVTLNNMPKFTGTADQITSQMMTYNRQWILQQMRSGRPILDIGLDPMRINPSIFYQMEQNMMKNYLKLHPNAFQIVTP